jgi:hypothetical protein
MTHLLQHVELAQRLDLAFHRQLRQEGLVAVAHVAHMAQPVVHQTHAQL